MRSLGIEDEEIKRFADPAYWIEYFPIHVKRDLELMGLKVTPLNLLVFILEISLG